MTEAKLQKLLLKGKTNPDSIAWFKAACDPFHDYDVSINGIPDIDGQVSVVQVMPKILTVKAPVNLGPGETWSCHICTLPLAQTVAVSSYNSVWSFGQSTLGHGDAQDGVLGTVSIITHTDTPSISNANYSFPRDNTPSFNSVKREFQAVSIDDVGGSSMKKLIAGGFEVHNDTAALYKQGSVTVYQSAQEVIDAGVGRWTHLENTADIYNSTKLCRQPPTDKTSAASLPNSRTWEAANGCYVPIRLGTETRYQPGTIHQFKTRYVDAVGTQKNGGYQQVASTGGLNPEPASYALAHRSCDIETTGAYFSGLSPETILTVTIKLIIESAPTAANPTLLFSATPTACYDPRIMSLYYQTIQSLPPGVEVRMNAKGDWFRMVMKAANTIAPVALPLIGMLGPEAVVGAEAALGLANAGLVFMDKRQAKKKEAPAQTKNSTKPPVGKAVSRPNRRK